MTFSIKFIHPRDYFYSDFVVEGIEAFPGESVAYEQEQRIGPYVRVQYNDKMRDYGSSHLFWSKEQYEEDWAKELEALKAKGEPAVFILRHEDKHPGYDYDTYRFYCLKEGRKRYTLFFGEGWPRQWEEYYREPMNPENIKRRCKNNAKWVRDTMWVEGYLDRIDDDHIPKWMRVAVDKNFHDGET